MNKLGGWQIKVSHNYPQKVASEVSEDLVLFGATYKAVCYLAYQQVSNGINHAILTEQTLSDHGNTKNVAILTLNEQYQKPDLAIIGVERIIESGGKLGGTQIDLTVEIPDEARNAFNKAYAEWTGSTIELVAYAGQKISNGIEYKFIATVSLIGFESKPALAVLTVNNMSDSKFSFDYCLS